MEDLNLLMVCISSFVAVFCVLVFLAGVIRLLIFCFPDKGEETDAAVFAAIHSVYAAVYPDSRITKIEEIKKGKK